MIFETMEQNINNYIGKKIDFCNVNNVFVVCDTYIVKSNLEDEDAEHIIFSIDGTITSIVYLSSLTHFSFIDVFSNETINII